jgi:hypothetical protein
MNKKEKEMKMQPQAEPSTLKKVMTKVKETVVTLPDTKREIILKQALQHEIVNEQQKLLDARKKKQLRPLIENTVSEFGIEDQDGHKHLVNEDETIEVVYQRRGGRLSLNTEKAVEILTEKGLLDLVMVEVTEKVLSEEKLYELAESGQLSRKEIDALFIEGDPTYALLINLTPGAFPDYDELQALRKKIEKMNDPLKIQEEIETYEG